jgi:hypothetical protein
MRSLPQFGNRFALGRRLFVAVFAYFSGRSLLARILRPLASRGKYWTPSPMFIHARKCPRYGGVDHIPDIVRNRLVSLRACDAAEAVFYELGDASTALRRTHYRHGVSQKTAAIRSIFIPCRPGRLLCVATRVWLRLRASDTAKHSSHREISMHPQDRDRRAALQ